MFELLKKYFKKGGFDLINYHFEYTYIRLYFIKDGIKFDIHILDDDFIFPDYLLDDIKNNNFIIKNFGNYTLISYSNKNVLIELCEKISKTIFENYRHKIFLRENSFLGKFIELDSKIKEKTLIYSNKNDIKPINYLFQYKGFKNLIFYIENGNEIIFKDINTIIILLFVNCMDLLKSDLNKLFEIKKIYIGYLDNVISDYENLCLLFNNYNVNVISNNKKEHLSELISDRNKFNVDIDIFDYSYIGHFDLYGHSRNLIIGDVDEKYYSDVLISIGPSRNIDFFLENIDFFKKYKCKFINIKHHSFEYYNKIEELISMKIENFEFLNFLSETDYNLYFKNSKIIVIPFYEDEVNPWWMTFTQGDAMMYGKALFVGENFKTKLFYREYEKGFFNYGILRGDYINLMKKILEDDDFRHKIEEYSYYSYIKDISIERMLLKFLN